VATTSASPTHPVPNPQRDSGLKYRRGCDHFAPLETEWQRFTQGFNSELQTTVLPGELQFRLGRFSELPTSEWSVVVGDCVQNFRAALDHMAWHLSVRERGAHPTRIEFPIFGDQAQYQRDAPRKVAGVPTAATKIIESLQPFHRGPAFAEHPLWKLHELATIDKHRRFHIGHVSLEAVTVSVGSDRWRRSREQLHRPFEPSRGCSWRESPMPRSPGSGSCGSSRARS
jgi:hypothetical protein